MKVRPPRRQRARAPRRRDRPRRRARDRAEARRAGGARALERRRPGPAAAARRRAADPDPDHARQGRPDALYVLRHSSAHLLAEAVRRLYPGVKVAIGPPIENGFYYDFEFPEPIGEADLERIEAEVERELAEGREWSREEVVAPTRRATRFEAEGEPYKVELVDTAEGAISLYTQSTTGRRVHRPLPRAAPPELGADQGVQADRPRRRLLARRRAQHPADPDLRHGVLLAGRSRRATSSGSRRRSKRDHRRLGTQLDLFHFSDALAGLAVLAPEGDGDLERARGPAPAREPRRGYVEVRTPQIYDKELWVTSGHWEKYREHMFTFESENREFGLKPMNCPGHCALYADGAYSYRELPLRFAEAGVAPPRRARPARCTACCACACSRRTTRTSSARPSRSRTRCSPASTSATRSTTSSGSRSRSSSRRGPRTSSAPTRSGTPPRRRSRAALERRGLEYIVERRRRRLLRAEDRPAHARLARPLLADRDRPARLPDAAALRRSATRAPTTPSTRR